VISSHNTFRVCAFLALLCPAVPQAATVQVAGLQGYIQAAPVIPAVFGNREQGIDLEVHGASPLKGPLVADLFQVSGELALPLVANLRLMDSVSLTGAPFQPLHVSIKFPDVKQRAQILVRLSIGGAPMATALGDLHFDVFPVSVTKELTGLLQPGADSSVPVALFGPGRKLRVFFGAIGVRFEDAGLHVPGELEPKRFYLAEPAPGQEIPVTQELKNTARVAIFAPDPSLPPGIYAEHQGSGVVVQVTEPLLDNLGVDPRAQLALIKVIHLLNPQPSTQNPSSP